jgi:hypothetical protein
MKAKRWVKTAVVEFKEGEVVQPWEESHKTRRENTPAINTRWRRWKE